jgi:hypothetical protein
MTYRDCRDWIIERTGQLERFGILLAMCESLGLPPPWVVKVDMDDALQAEWRLNRPGVFYAEVKVVVNGTMSHRVTAQDWENNKSLFQCIDWVRDTLSTKKGVA